MKVRLRDFILNLDNMEVVKLYRDNDGNVVEVKCHGVSGKIHRYSLAGEADDDWNNFVECIQIWGEEP